MQMHKLLQRLLRRHLVTEETIPEALRPLLAAISVTFDQNDADRAMLDHSMNTVSQEMLDRNRRLHESLEGQARHEQKLALALAMLRDTIEFTADGILVIDGASKVVLINARYGEMWACRPSCWPRRTCQAPRLRHGPDPRTRGVPGPGGGPVRRRHRHQLR